MPRESKHARLERMHAEYRLLCARFPTPRSALHFANPLQLLVATVLSAQTTDRRVNMVTPELFAAYPDAHALASADPLVTLPGVGRKTANVVLGNAFAIPGFPVDTHVIRVTARLRWRDDWNAAHPDPVHIEREICACFPPSEWTNLSHRLILHGRDTCRARNPECGVCPLAATCPSAFAFTMKPIRGVRRHLQGPHTRL